MTFLRNGQRFWAGSVLLLASLAACDPAAPSADASTPAEAKASPNASILPAPLASGPPEVVDAGGSVADAAVQGLLADRSGRFIFPDAGVPPPEIWRGDLPVPVDVPGARDLSGVTIEAAWRFRDVPAPPKASEVNLEGIKAAQKLTELIWRIDLTDTGRMRIEFNSRALPLPMHTELRGRTDRYGHILLWPNSTNYRVIPPGALRTVLGERRVDVTPLSSAAVVAQGDGKKLGLLTRKVQASSSLGTLRLELGKAPEAGEGGALLCRALVEIAGLDPKVPFCQAGEVPLSASYAWQDGGGIALEATAFTRRTDFSPGDVVAPPSGATYTPAGLPIATEGIFLTRSELAAFRAAPLALPPSSDPAVPGEGFIAVNRTDRLVYLLLDGIAVVAVPANSERYLIGTTRGRYVVQWRTFLGEQIAPPVTLELPARITYGSTPDAGLPDGG